MLFSLTMNLAEKENLLGKHVLVFGEKVSHRLNRYIETVLSINVVIQVVIGWAGCC